LRKRDKYQELLGKYFSGNCTEEEKTYVENWLNKSPDIQAIYDEFDEVWKVTGYETYNAKVDIHKDWIELNKRIAAVESITEEEYANHLIISRRLVYFAARIAAVLVFAFGFMFFFNQIKKESAPVNMHYTATEVLQSPFILADGSEVFLNNEAEISYPEEFASNIRKINFEGNAFFNIAHNPEKPFIISVGNLEVEVLGTSFNLSACPASDEIVLCLESGKVRFSSINPENGNIKEQFILLPGQKGIFNKITGQIGRSKIKDQNYLAWKTGVLVFDKAPVDEVICAIEQTYNLKVNTTKSFDGKALTARYENESPENIFESLHTIFGINYAFDGKNVFLN
jgi:ferric-dicitrate binding protein FerR (iron transport regulator)